MARRAVAVGSWLSLGAALAAWGVVHLGDDWWPGTFLMFAPRWVWAIPPAAAVPAALALRRRSAVPAAIGLAVALGLVMGLCIPWRPLLTSPPDGVRLRVFTCNMHYGKTDPALLDSALIEAQPDVVALQEWRDSAHSWVLDGGDWFVHRLPGLCLASRYPIQGVERLGEHSTSPHGSVMRSQVLAPRGTVTVFVVHLDSPREGLGEVAGKGWEGSAGLEANSERRGEQLEFLSAAGGRVAGPLLLIGDFNTPPESTLLRRNFGDYADAFGEAGWGWGYTFRSRATRVRIDHILVGGDGHALNCRVGPDVGSPHRPVIAEVRWPAASP